MRSRYAAFSIGDAEYLWRTLHPANPDREEGEAATKAHLRAACREQRFMGLHVLDRSNHQVLFIARVFQKGHDRSFVELSDFAHDGEGLRYLGGITKRLCDIAFAERLRFDSFASV